MEIEAPITKAFRKVEKKINPDESEAATVPARPKPLSEEAKAQERHLVGASPIPVEVPAKKPRAKRLPKKKVPAEDKHVEPAKPIPMPEDQAPIVNGHVEYSVRHPPPPIYIGSRLTRRLYNV